MEYTWSDYGDDRGFHIFDTDTLELTYVKNTEPMFFKIFYADTGSGTVITPDNFFKYEGKYVKVIVQEKNDPYAYDQWMGQLTEAGCADISVVEDHFNAQRLNESDLVDAAEDTLTTLTRYIQSLEGTVDKPAVDKLLRSLYNEATNMEDTTV
jgi:hypothetical protein